MRIIIDGRNKSYEEFQEALGMEESFDLVDSILWLMDYGEGDNTTTHNGLKLTFEED